VPTLGLLVILYIGALLPKQPYVYNSILCFYYIKIRYLNSSNVFHKRITDTSELPKPIPHQNLSNSQRNILTTTR
jgi:hypothetical protein